jgi:hypothetical protein
VMTCMLLLLWPVPLTGSPTVMAAACVAVVGERKLERPPSPMWSRPRHRGGRHATRRFGCAQDDGRETMRGGRHLKVSQATRHRFHAALGDRPCGGEERCACGCCERVGRQTVRG